MPPRSANPALACKIVSNDPFIRLIENVPVCEFGGSTSTSTVGCGRLTWKSALRKGLKQGSFYFGSQRSRLAAPSHSR